MLQAAALLEDGDTACGSATTLGATICAADVLRREDDDELNKEHAEGAGNTPRPIASNSVATTAPSFWDLSSKAYFLEAAFLSTFESQAVNNFQEGFHVVVEQPQ